MEKLGGGGGMGRGLGERVGEGGWGKGERGWRGEGGIDWFLIGLPILGQNWAKPGSLYTVESS